MLKLGIAKIIAKIAPTIKSGWTHAVSLIQRQILAKKAKLKELNHQIFLAKRNVDKQRLKKEIQETRHALADAIENTGFVSQGAAQLLANWDMFDQNASSSFFDSEWMFGVKDGFDIVIANPPYVVVPKNNMYSGLFVFTIASSSLLISAFFIFCANL